MKRDTFEVFNITKFIAQITNVSGTIQGTYVKPNTVGTISRLHSKRKRKQKIF